MYSGLAGLVLFDARGAQFPLETLVYAAAVLCVFFMAVTYIPVIFHRPQRVDDLCADLITFGTHATGIAVLISDPQLIYACALHSICFFTQRHVLPKAQIPVLVHTVVILTALACYAYGPRITNIHHYVISAVSPHALDLFSSVLVQVHRFLVSWIAVEL
jgi:hypothetical protein